MTISSTGQTFNYSTDGNYGVAPQVVINEVAWPGSAASPYDEWIELYNTTGSAINLTGWKIVDDSGAQTYNLSGTIASHSGDLCRAGQSRQSLRRIIQSGKGSRLLDGERAS